MRFPQLKPRRFTQKHRGEMCLNCEHPLHLSDRFCPNCAQKNSTKKISFRDLIEELFSSLFSYDSKLWFTVKELVKNPGKLTKNFVEGRRAQYVNPFRFFLSLAILFFLITSINIKNEEYEDLVKALDEIDFYEVSQENSPTKKTKSTISTSSVIDSTSLNFENNKTSDSIFKNLNLIQKLVLNFQEKRNYKYETAIKEGLLEDNFSGLITFRFVRGITKIKNNFIEYLKYLQAKIPFFMFFFIPIFSLFNFLIFWRSKRSFVDHLVFNFNMSSLFIFIYSSYKITTALFTNKIVSLLFLLLILIYLFRAILLFYKTKKILCFFKTLVYFSLYSVTLFVFLIVSMLLSFMFY